MASANNLEGTGSSPHIYRAAGRVAGKTLRRNRLLRATAHGAGTAFRAVARTLRALFLEMMGLFFLLFALAGGFATYRAYSGEVNQKVGLSAAFTLLFLYFAATSFWRARRKGR